MRIRNMVHAFLFLPLLAAAGCSDDSSSGGGPGVFVTGAAFYNQIDGSYVVADVTREGVTLSDATVTVNGTPLTYGFPLVDDGWTAGTLPIYFGRVDFKPGDRLTLQAYLPGIGLFYEGTVTVPGQILFSQPPPDPQVTAGTPLVTSWNSAPNTLLYDLDYSPWGGEDWSMSSATQLAATIPAAYVVEGDTDLTVAAYNGDHIGDIFIEDTPNLENDEPDPPQTTSYWLASTYDYRDFAVTAPQAVGELGKSADSVSAGNVVPLEILQQDRVTIDGIRFTKTIYRAEQIVNPGTAHIMVTMKKRHLAIVDITVLDANQQAYYNWRHKRVYCSHNKGYKKDIALTPYSTVVIHTKRTKIRYADYEY